MATITICSSAAFYKQAVDIQKQLENVGYEVVVPKTAKKMQEIGNFDVTHYKTWFSNASDYYKKADLMRTHFERISEGDAILVLNYEKNGKQNYVGANVLMEMALAFFLHKPIFILNEIPEDSPFIEEVKGMMPTELHGSVESFPQTFEKIWMARQNAQVVPETAAD